MMYPTTPLWCWILCRVASISETSDDLAAIFAVAKSLGYYFDFFVLCEGLGNLGPGQDRRGRQFLEFLFGNLYGSEQRKGQFFKIFRCKIFLCNCFSLLKRQAEIDFTQVSVLFTTTRYGPSLLYQTA